MKNNDNIKFNVPQKGSDNRFLDKKYNIEYIRSFGLWKCVKCHKRWYSAYTWLSLKFIENNKELYKGKINSFHSKDTEEKENAFSVLQVFLADDGEEKLQKEKRVYFKGPVIDKHSIENKYALQQHCKSCKSKDNKVIYYSNLWGAKNTEDSPHRSDLCAKCLKGYPCRR